MEYNCIQLLKTDGTWAAFEADWRKQCASYKEDFDDFAAGTFSVVNELVEKENTKAGLFAFAIDGCHKSICQINTAGLPGYDSPVMRVRYLTMCPELDFGDNDVDTYADALITAFAGILSLSDAHPTLNANHIKFHLSSPNDRSFFSLLSRGLNDASAFKSVRHQGSWLYVTKI